MRAVMRPIKTQFSQIVRFTTPGQFEIDLSKYALAGYTDVESLVIGGAGGNSGRNEYTDSGGISRINNPAAGGGGGSRYRIHKLKDLPLGTRQGILVGSAGTNGADKNGFNAGRAGDGQPGGMSLFGIDTTWNSADGGSGGEGGGSYEVGWPPQQVHAAAVGGDGGHTDYGVAGVPGQGGTNSTGIQDAVRAPANGTWTTTGLTLPDLAVGVGGGGGAGSKYVEGEYNRLAQNGASGAGTSGNQYSPGAPRIGAGGGAGGGGGGCRELFLTGSDLTYGSPYPAASVKMTGAVILKFS